jgi:hypothetical protein
MRKIICRGKEIEVLEKMKEKPKLLIWCNERRNFVLYI